MDENTQDQVLVFMALARGISAIRVTPRSTWTSKHTETTMVILEKVCVHIKHEESCLCMLANKNQLFADLDLTITLIQLSNLLFTAEDAWSEILVFRLTSSKRYQ